MDKFRYTVQLENLINYYNGQTPGPKFLCYFLTLWFIWLSCSGDQKSTKARKNLAPKKWERLLSVTFSSPLLNWNKGFLHYQFPAELVFRKTLKDQKLKDIQNFPLQHSERHRIKWRKQLLFYCCSVYYLCITYWRICHIWHKLWPHQWQ